MSNEIENATALCPHCLNPTHEVANPFYGTGMSVHEWLTVCDVCSIATYKRNPDPVRVLADDVERKHPWSWLVKRSKRTARSR